MLYVCVMYVMDVVFSVCIVSLYCCMHSMVVLVLMYVDVIVMSYA